MHQQVPTILRLPQVMALTGLSRSSIYKYIADRSFPRPFRLGPRAVGFSAAAIEAWMAARIAGSSDQDIRELVAQMEVNRNPSATAANNDVRDGRARF